MTSAPMLRPPVERPMTPAAEQILTAAATLFYRHGIRAVGVKSIAEAAETTKKTIYDRFGSKDGLIVAYLHRRSLRWRMLVLDFIAPELAGRAQALAVFDATDHPGVAIIVEEKTWIRDLFEYICVAGGYHDPNFIAGQLTLLHEGSIAVHTAGAQSDASAVARQTAQMLLGVDDRMTA